MNIAILGSGGYIAEKLRSAFSEKDDCDVKMIGRRADSDYHYDLVEYKDFDYSILSQFDQVIVAAAISGPDMCAKQYEYCWKVNVEGTEYFIQKAIEAGCRVLFYSSDAVYGNDVGVVFDEDTTINPSTPYGEMKAHVENKFEGNEKFKAIRLSYVVSAEDKFSSYCLKCINNGETAEIFHPFYRSCVTLKDVIDATYWIVTNWNEFESQKLNLAGEELVSRVRIADEINRIYENKLLYSIIKPDELFFKNRPVITQITSKYLWNYKIVNKESFTEKLQKQMEEIII